jgi:hypothetical protein
MLPLAIPAIASVAGSVIQAYHKAGDAKAQAQAQQASKVDFNKMLTNAGSAGVQNPQGIQGQLAALPEVKAALASNAPGTQVKFSMSGQGLSLISANGTQQPIALSPASQSAIRNMSAMNSGAPTSVTLTA